MVGFAIPSNALSQECHTIEKHLRLDTGDVNVDIGWTQFNTQVCTDSGSMNYTSADTYSGVTGPGNLGGFNLDFYNPDRVAYWSGAPFQEGHVIYHADGALQPCIVHIVPICGLTCDFREKVQVNMWSAMYWTPYDGYHFSYNNSPRDGYFWLNHRYFHWTVWAVNTDQAGCIKFKD